MKRNALKLGGIFYLLFFILNACNDSSEEVDPCQNGPGLNVDNVTASIEGASSGEISVSASSGTSPYTYSIDEVNFQNNGTFSNLSANNYTLTVKDANGCTDSQTVALNEVPEVSFVSQIKPIIDTNCQLSNCHGNQPGIPTYATYADVYARASLIKTRTSNQTMPPDNPLDEADIQLISDWVDQGAPNN